MLYLFHMPIYQHRFHPYLQRALPLFKAFLGSYTLVDGCQLGSYSHRSTVIWTNFITPPRLFASLPLATSVYDNVLSFVVDRGRQPLDIMDDDIYPFPVNTFGKERKAFAMLTPFPEDPEKLVVLGRPGQNLLRVSTDGTVSYVTPTAYEWERVVGYQVGDMNGSGPHDNFPSRCLDRNICTWLASLLSASHTPSIFPVPEHGKISSPLTNLGGSSDTTMLPRRYPPTFVPSATTRVATYKPIAPVTF